MNAPEFDTEDTVAAEMPNSLVMLLEPTAALEAARRMQQWYQTTPQGAAHSLFGRDGRRVEGRLRASLGDGFDIDHEHA